MTNPVLGVWYIGFYGVSNSTFAFRFSEERVCPMKCSLHGACVGTRCQCNRTYSGTSCEDRTENVDINATYVGYVDSNYWNYFRYNSNSMTPFVVKLISYNSSDCDIYVRYNSKPTRWNFVFRNISALPNTELVVHDPGQRLWYIGIFGATSCNYSVVISTRTNCTACVNGVCVAGLCQCNPGFAGEDCSTSTKTANATLVKGIPAGKAKVMNGKWMYYEFPVVNASQLVVVVRETSTQGMVWLYISQGRFPDNGVFESIDVTGDTNMRSIILEYFTPKTSTFYVGVYGSPFIVGTTTEVEYDIVAWYTPF